MRLCHAYGRLMRYDVPRSDGILIREEEAAGVNQHGLLGRAGVGKDFIRNQIGNQPG